MISPTDTTETRIRTGLNRLAEDVHAQPDEEGLRQRAGRRRARRRLAAVSAVAVTLVVLVGVAQLHAGGEQQVRVAAPRASTRPDPAVAPRILLPGWNLSMYVEETSPPGVRQTVAMYRDAAGNVLTLSTIGAGFDTGP